MAIMGAIVVEAHNHLSLYKRLHPKNKINNTLIYFSPFLIGTLVVMPAVAGQWTTIPSINLSETYSDNVSLSPTGMEIDDYITKSGFSLNMNGVGRSGTIVFNYDLENIKYSETEEFNATNQMMSSLVHLNIIKERLFLDLNATYDQRYISPDSQISFDGLSSTENQTDVLNYSISPYYNLQVGRDLNGILRYTRRVVDYQDSDLDSQDITRDEVLAEVTNESHDRRLSWLIRYNGERERNDSTPELQLESTEIELTYKLTNKFYLLGRYGYESNNYTAVSNVDSTEGEKWAAGFDWKVGRRVQLHAVFGESYYGETGEVVAEYKGRNSEAEFIYNQELLTVLAGHDSEFNGGDNLQQNYLPTEIAADVIYRERYSIILSKNIAKSIFRLNVYTEENIYQSTLDNVNNAGATFLWNWRISPKTELNFDMLSQKIDFRSNLREDELSRLGLRLTRSIRQSFSTYIEYVFTNNESNNELFSYQRNLITLGVEARL